MSKMRKSIVWIIFLLLSVFLPFLMQERVAFAADKEVYNEYLVDASKMTCLEFTEFTNEAKDTHRTRLCIQTDFPCWDLVTINDHAYDTESKLLENIFVNGKSVHDYRVEYRMQWFSGTEPKIESTDYYFVEDYKCDIPTYRPINVIFNCDWSTNTNFIDIYIPTDFLSPLEVVSVGFSGSGSLLNYKSYDPAIYRIEGEVSIRNPKLPPPKPVYTVSIDGMEERVEEGSLLKQPQNIPTKAETVSHTYEFIGWYYEKDGEWQAWDFSADVVYGDLVLTAEFLPIEKIKYRFTFDGEEVYAYEGSYLDVPNDPSPENTAEYIYTFWGWFYEKDGESVRWDFEKDVATQDVTLTSKITCAKARYYVYFYPSVDSEFVSALYLEWGDEIEYPSLVDKFGYEVGIWMQENGEVGPTVMPTHEVSLYPVWVLKEYKASVVCGKECLFEITYTIETAEEARIEMENYIASKNNLSYEYMWIETIPQKLPYQDETIYHVERSLIKYVITFAGVTGIEPIVFTSESLIYVQLPEVPEKSGYTGRWNKTLYDIKLEDTIITAIYTKEEFVVEEESLKGGGCGGYISGTAISFIGLSLVFQFIKKEEKM